jgi:hypothetical protein
VDNHLYDRVISSYDRAVLRAAASRVAEIAALPQMAERREKWFAHNSLQSSRPMMLIFPEGSWEELIPPSTLKCEGEFTREIESRLRERIYTFEHFQDDSVIEAEWVEQGVIGDSGWGVEVQRVAATEARGTWKFEPVLHDEMDLRRLHYPELIYDPAQSQRNTEQMQDLFGGILRVEPAGVKFLAYHLMKQYTNWCGLEEMMTDMLDRPEFVHTVMRFLVVGHQRFLAQLVDAALLSLNNDNTYHSSGGNGYTRELPAAGFDPAHVRPCDRWCSAESQEMALVSPRMHSEFVLQYEKQLLAPFGLNGYGCCEDLSCKLDDVCTIPNIRRISISPFADVDRSAEQLKNKAIFSWKAHPAQLVGDFDPGQVRAYLRHMLEVCHEQGCIVEMILKDTHTCEFHPERFDRWTQIAREEIRRMGWE